VINKQILLLFYTAVYRVLGIFYTSGTPRLPLSSSDNYIRGQAR